MHDIAAVAAGVFADQPTQGLGRAFVQHHLAGAGSTRELRQNAGQDKSGQRENHDRVVIAVAQHKKQTAQGQADHKRNGKLPSEAAPACPPPGNNRPDAGQE